MSAREAILGRVRRSLGVTGDDAERRAAVAQRLAETPRGVIPARGQLEPEERVRRFAMEAEKAHARLREVTPDAVAPTIQSFLTGLGLPATIVSGEDARLPDLLQGLPVERRPITPHDLAAVSHAEAGAAEAGTLVTLTGPDNPTLLSFLPLVHVLLVARGDILGDLESAVALARSRLGPAGLPRAMHFITGPSRSGDIEQQMVLGAHGPGHLLVLIVRQPGEAPWLAD